MSDKTARELLDAIGEGLEAASRWPQLLSALGFEPEQGRPGPLLLNNALQRLGYRRALDEGDSMILLAERSFPDAWWKRIAAEVTGNSHAKVEDVVARLRHAPRAAAE
ncbi:MAG TPA: hypothetical protein VHL34_11860 [Rhizomicrobium sp.]|nr:hypothetical protein [Rhizomicrobium sp.]